jgi:hypothetical protein
MRGRFDILQRVLTLDPERDCQEIVFLVGAYEYPFLMQKALEFALFRTYAVPSIGALLDHTRQFYTHAQRRYDDTSLLIAEFVQHGYDSERGRKAIAQMNRQHHRYSISNDDFLYVLGTFIFTPIDWHARWGWRKPTAHENRANFYFWREVGKRMNIKDMPTTFEAYEAFFRAYERENFRYTPESRRVADATIAVFLSWYPRFLRPLIRQGIYAMMDDPLREAFGYPKAHPLVRAGVWLGLKGMATYLRYLAFPRKQPFLLTEQYNRSYPQGYTLEELGADNAPRR